MFYSMARFHATISMLARDITWSKHLIIPLIAASSIISGCMSLVPRSTSVVPLPDGIIEYRNPSFDNQISPLGWVSIASMTAGGAYQGYHSNLKLRWTGWERKSEIQTVGNTALGALTGLASGLLVTWIMGGGTPVVTTDNATLWLEKMDDRMMLIPSHAEYPGLPLKSIQAVARRKDAAIIPNYNWTPSALVASNYHTTSSGNPIHDTGELPALPRHSLLPGSPPDTISSEHSSGERGRSTASPSTGNEHGR